MTLPLMCTFKSTQSLSSPLFFLCHTTGDALVTPGCTGSRMPCLTICSSFSVTLSRRGRGIFLALQNIGCVPGINFTWALNPSQQVGARLWCCSRRAWVEGLYQVVQILYQTAQLQVVFEWACFHSTQSHKKVIPEALIDEHPKLQDVLSYHTTEVYQAQSLFLMISLCYLHLCLPAFLLCSYLLRYIPMSQTC